MATSLDIGSKPVTAVNIGSTPAMNVYLGATRVWSSIKSYTVDFTKMANGPFPSTFDMTKTGGGNGSLHIASNSAAWTYATNNQDNTIVAIYNQGGTSTDYQVVTGNVNNVPDWTGVGSNNGAATIGGIARYKDPDNYVYAFAYCSSFLNVVCELGCYVGGVKHVFATNMPANWDTKLSLMVGVSGNPYRFRLMSSNSIYVDYTDTNHVSQLGYDCRGWGFKVTTADSGVCGPPGSTFVSCYDNPS